jgi:hypothetical protein
MYVSTRLPGMIPVPLMGGWRTFCGGDSGLLRSVKSVGTKNNGVVHTKSWNEREEVGVSRRMEQRADATQGQFIFQNDRQGIQCLLDNFDFESGPSFESFIIVKRLQMLSQSKCNCEWAVRMESWRRSVV